MHNVTTALLAHRACGHSGDAAMKLIQHAPEMFRDVLSNGGVTGLRHQCEECHLASNIRCANGHRAGQARPCGSG